MLRSCLMLIALLAFAGHTLAFDEKIDAKLLIGKWEPEMAPPGIKVVMEFKKEDKLEINIEVQGKQEKVEGTYKVEGNKLTVTMKREGQEITQNATIVKLEKDSCIIKDDKRNEEQKLKKIS